MIGGAGNKGDSWGSTSFKIPVPYLRVREDRKDFADKKTRFIEAPGDGPAYKLGKEERHRFYHLNVYGKDGNEPPISYLKSQEWAVKKPPKKEENKSDKKKEEGRGSFIDAIFFNGEKYKLPGPDRYFQTEKGKDQEKKDKKTEEGKEKKKYQRLNFLCDAEYLGMNYPCPGTYPHKDTWPTKDEKKKTTEEEKKKIAYKPGSWRVVNDKKQGPGDYEVVRLMTVIQPKDGEKEKSLKKFASIPVFSRTALGIINKKHETKRATEAPQLLAAPGSYFKENDQLEKTYRKITKPMRKY